MGTEMTKGLGEPWGVPGVMPPCATSGKREPTLPWRGPLAPQEPRLVFQSRRAGIFSVQQISLMAQR